MIKKEILKKKVEDGYFLIDAEQELILEINELGYFIFDSISANEGITMDRLCRIVVSAYEADALQIEADVHDFVHQLIAKGIITSSAVCNKS